MAKAREQEYSDLSEEESETSSKDFTEEEVTAVNTNYKYSEQDIDLVVETYIKHKLGGYKVEPYRKFLLKGLFGPDYDGNKYKVAITGAIDHAGTGTPLGFFLDKSFQQPPDPGCIDNRRDVFDEIVPVIQEIAEVNVKILFPFNILQHHWLTGEVNLRKKDNRVSVSFIVHDPFGGGVVADDVYYQITNIIENTLQEDYGYGVDIQPNTYSPYLRRQAVADGTSCGVIVADEIIKRIHCESLDMLEITGDGIQVSTPHGIGAAGLREEQVALINNNLTEETDRSSRDSFVQRTTFAEVLEGGSRVHEVYIDTKSKSAREVRRRLGVSIKQVVDEINKIENDELKRTIKSAFAVNDDIHAYTVGVLSSIEDSALLLISNDTKISPGDTQSINILQKMLCKNRDYFLTDNTFLLEVGVHLGERRPTVILYNGQLKTVCFQLEFRGGGHGIPSIDTRNLPPMFYGAPDWRDLKPFTVLAGVNGIGKSQLLKYISHNLADDRGMYRRRDGNALPLHRRGYLFPEEIVYVDADHDLRRSGSTQRSQDLSYWIRNPEQKDKIISQVREYYESKKEPEEDFANEVIKSIDRSGADTEKEIIPTDTEITNAIYRTITYHYNELKLTEPISFVRYLVDMHQERIKIIAESVDNLSGAGLLWNFYKKLSDKERKLIDLVSSENNKLDAEKFFLKLSHNIAFKREVINDYAVKRAGPSPLVSLNRLLEENGFIYKFGIGAADPGYRARGAENLVLKRKDTVVDPREISSGERLILSLTCWQFYSYGLGHTGEKQDRLLENKVRIMLLDEPDAHLDPKLSRIYYDIIHKLTKPVGEGGQGIQVIMTTHRIDTIALAPPESVHTIVKGDSGLIVKHVPKMLVMLRMANNLHEILDYRYRVYAESTTDARFYQGVYESLKQISDQVRREESAHEKLELFWKPDLARKPFRLLSNRHVLEFHSVSEGDFSDRHKARNLKQKGGCSKVKGSIKRDATAYHNLFEGDKSSRSGVTLRWKKLRKVIDNERMYYSFGLLDNDYGTDHNLAKEGISDRVTVMQDRHSVENFMLDPIVMMSVLSSTEISNFIEKSNLVQNADSAEEDTANLTSVCLNIKHYLEENRFDQLQPYVDEFFRVVMCTMVDRHRKWRHGDAIKAEEIPVYASMQGRVDETKPLCDIDMIYVVGKGKSFSVRYSSDYLRIRGHDIEEFFLGSRNPYNPVDILANRIFYEGLRVIPIDLASLIFSVANRARSNARGVLKPEELDRLPNMSENSREIEKSYKNTTQDDISIRTKRLPLPGASDDKDKQVRPRSKSGGWVERLQDHQETIQKGSLTLQ